MSLLGAVERTGRTGQTTSFGRCHLELRVAYSAGVIDVGASDTTKTRLKRTKTALRPAKRNGRNGAVLDAGNGPEPITASDFDVRGRVYHHPI